MKELKYKKKTEDMVGLAHCVARALREFGFADIDKKEDLHAVCYRTPILFFKWLDSDMSIENFLFSIGDDMLKEE